MTLIKVAGRHRAKQKFAVTCHLCGEKWIETREWQDWVRKATIFFFTCPRCGNSTRQTWQVFKTRFRKRQRPSQVALLKVPPGSSIGSVKGIAEKYDSLVIGRRKKVVA